MSILDNSSTSTGSPWSPLTPGVMQGADFMRNLLTRGAYGGPYISPINGMQTGGINAGYGNAGSAGGVASAYGGAGAGILGGIDDSYDYYQNAMGGGANPWMTHGDDYMNLAGRFANNPYMDQSIQAALRDPYRDLTENAMPGSHDMDIMTGGSGGSGGAIERGIMQRGYADRASDVGAQMRMAGLQQGYGVADNAANADYALSQHAADNLFQMGGQGLDWMGQGYDFGQKGAMDMFNWGGQEMDLGNKQIEANMNQFYAPWELGKSYGSYFNPLAGSLKTETTDQNMMGAYLFQGLGPILSGIGSSVGDDAWDWIKNIWGDINPFDDEN